MPFKIVPLSMLLLVVVCLESQPLQAETCPVLESRNWHAWIDKVLVRERKGRLNITGQIDLPSPGYAISWKLGPLDRAKPPGQRLSLDIKPPDGMVIQVLTPTQIHIQTEAQVLEFREVAIYCEGTLLASLPGVTPTE